MTGKYNKRSFLYRPTTTAFSSSKQKPQCPSPHNSCTPSQPLIFVVSGRWQWHLRRNANDTASGPAARIARLLALLVAALAEVVGAGVHDDGAAEHALGPDELDELVADAALAVALAVRLEVAQVADVALAVLGRAVRLALGVDWVEETAMSAVLCSLRTGADG